MTGARSRQRPGAPRQGARAVPAGDDAVIRCEHVTVTFGTRCAVDDLALTVRRGEQLALLGPTGSGKSTILNVLVGAVARAGGEVDVLGFDPEQHFFELQGRFAIAFQDARLVPWRTAVQNVALGLRILGRKRRERLAAARYWLERVKLSDALQLYPSQLSGGMQQRVSLARAFAVEPDILYLDEAFSKLDAVTAQSLRGDFRELANKVGSTSLIVTHDIDEAIFLADRIVVLGVPARVLADYRVEVASEADRTALRNDIVDTLRRHADALATAQRET